jgi:hypothetical protein
VHTITTFTSFPDGALGKALKAVGESGEIPLSYYAVNVGATTLLLQAMHDFGCHRFVYSSSATVYGIPPVVPIPETTILKAESVYGRTKIMSETIIKDLCYGEPFPLNIYLKFLKHRFTQLILKHGRLSPYVTSSEFTARLCPPVTQVISTPARQARIPPGEQAKTLSDAPETSFLCSPKWPVAASKTPSSRSLQTTTRPMMAPAFATISTFSTSPLGMFLR